MNTPDFENLIKQFKNTEDLKFLAHVGNRVSEGLSMDQHIYLINTDQGVHFVYEVDFIGDFQTDVINVIEREMGKFQKIYEVENPITDFKTASPVLATQVYKKPEDWETISKYANDKFGSHNYYFNFLIKE